MSQSSLSIARFLPGKARENKALAAPESGSGWLDDIRARESAEVARARAAAIGFGVLSGVLGASLAAVVLITPPLPVYVLETDAITGAPGALTRVDELVLSADEARDRYWLRQFVLARESYNAYTVTAREYRTVSLMAADDVADRYEADVIALETEHVGRLADVRIEVDIESVSIAEGGGVATVRFKRTITEPTQRERGPVVERRVATIAYEFVPSVTMAMADRIENPLAFRVLSYSIDEVLS